MSTTFVFVCALLVGLILGLLTPMVVAYVSTIRVAVYRKDKTQVDLSSWGVIPGVQPQDSQPMLDIDLPKWLNEPAPAKDW